MLWLGILLGAAGVAGSLVYPSKLDRACREAWMSLRNGLSRLIAPPPPPPQEDLFLVSRLISSLRSGLSLDSALELTAEEAPPSLRQRIRALLEGRPAPDFLASFLHSALLGGGPVLGALQSFEQALETKRRLGLRARSSTAQCRAQAEALSWLPWGMALSLYAINSSWFHLAAASPLAWLLWSAALALAGLGRRWMRFTLERALSPRNARERFEEELFPDLSLRILAELSQGCDAETAAERAFSQLCGEQPRAAAGGLSGSGGHGALARLQALLRHATRTGAPLREDLLALLASLRAETEARWEERVQRLPVVLLGPLFLCFFPCSMLVLAGMLLPLLQEAW